MRHALTAFLVLTLVCCAFFASAHGASPDPAPSAAAQAN
jgi:hypothetical protein